MSLRELIMCINNVLLLHIMCWYYCVLCAATEYYVLLLRIMCCYSVLFCLHANNTHLRLRRTVPVSTFVIQCSVASNAYK